MTSSDPQLIAACRRQAGLSRAELASLMGVSEGLIDLWESEGYEGVDLALLRRVASATGRELEIRFRTEQRATVVPHKDAHPIKKLKTMGTHAALVLLALVGAGAAAGCITETESSVRRPASGTMKTEGVRIVGELEPVWRHVQETMAGLTGEPLLSRGIEKSIVTTVSGAEVKVLVEPYDKRNTIIHITSSDARVADAVRMRILAR